MTCRKCGESRPLCDFLNKNSNLLLRCKTCVYMNERLYKFKLKFGLDLAACQNSSCPDKSIGNDIRFLRFRDDGLVCCLGCIRHKNRKGKYKNHRYNLCAYFVGRSCMYCHKTCNSSNVDFFDMICSNQILPYSKYTHLSSKKTENFFIHFKPDIICLQCTRKYISVYI